MKHENHINSFVEHFREFLCRVDGLPNELHWNVLKKLGCVALIDALSKVGAANTQRGRPRFVSFARQFSGWHDGERLSLSYLSCALLRETRPEFQQLREWALGRFQKWPSRGTPRSPYPISWADPLPDDLLSLWPEGRKIQLSEKVALAQERFSHFHLLCSRRNSLAHELRTGIWEASEQDSQEPYYRRVTMSGNDMWVLHYPTGFLSKLAVTCLKNLEEWLKAEDLDPYAYYKVGEFMLEEFFDFEETVNAALVADVWRHH